MPRGRSLSRNASQRRGHSVSPVGHRHSHSRNNPRHRSLSRLEVNEELRILEFLEQKTARRVGELRIFQERIKATIELNIHFIEDMKKLYDIQAQFEKLNEDALTDDRRKELEQDQRERDEMYSKMFEEHDRDEEALRRELIQLQRKEEEILRKLEMIRGQ